MFASTACYSQEHNGDTEEHHLLPFNQSDLKKQRHLLPFNQSDLQKQGQLKMSSTLCVTGPQSELGASSARGRVRGHSESPRGQR